MVNLKGRAILIFLAALSAGANGQEVQKFSISCGVGGHVSQHYEYDGNRFLFYTDSKAGKNVIKEMLDPSVVIEREMINGYEVQKIRVRGGRKALDAQETVASMQTVLLNGRIDKFENQQNPIWEEVVAETRLNVMFDVQGFVTQAFKESHMRKQCKLQELI